MCFDIVDELDVLDLSLVTGLHVRLIYLCRPVEVCNELLDLKGMEWRLEHQLGTWWNSPDHTMNDS